MTIGLMWLTTIAYGLLQIIMIGRTSGALRAASSVPLLVMIPAGAVTAYAFQHGNDFAPVLLLLLSPLSALYFLALMSVGHRGRTVPVSRSRGARPIG
jgi:hypothetical protein